MEKLKRLIGPAPSEMTPEELLKLVRARQELVAGTLQEFRLRMEGARSKPGPKAKKTSENLSLSDVLAQLKEQGMTTEDLRRLVRGGKT